MIEEIKNLKKVELHIHLDGSVPIKTIARLSGRSVEELTPEMVAADKCENLSDYLTRFDTPLKYMQTKENLYEISKEVADYLESQNVVYAEVRFAPMFHTKEGLSYNEIVEAVRDGLRSNPNVKTNLILCMMRGFPFEENVKTIEAAFEYLHDGVCALDLAGAEDQYPLEDYAELFKLAKQRFIPFTIHAGENASHKEIELAMQVGAKRIGHGIHANESLETQVLLKDKNVLLEMCPTSNVQTNAIETYPDHPLEFFYNCEVKVCVNTDNTTVSNITLNDEYIKLHEQFGMTIEQFKKMNMYAAESSFLTIDEQAELKELLK